LESSSQKTKNPKSKSEKFPFGFFWVLSKESKSKRAKFSWQFFGTFQHAEINRLTVYWDNEEHSRAAAEQPSF